MENKRFSYKKCMAELSRILPPGQAELPQVYDKSVSLREVNESLQKYKLPILYRYVPFTENWTMETIKSEDVYIVPATKLNDNFEGAPYGILSSYSTDMLEIERIQGEVYVKSFSCKKNNNLMWSHYGDSHKGICIGYDFSLAPHDVINHLYPVQYSDVRFTSKYSRNIAAHPFLYLRKSKCWAYEKEFRLLYKKNELPHENYNIHLNCITEIQFGLRTPECIKNRITNFMRDKNMQYRCSKQIKLFETKLKDKSFELERIEYVNPNF